MCKCLELTQEALKEHNTRLVTTMQFDPKRGKMRSLPQLMTEKLDKKSRKKPITVVPTYCPICGEKYPEKIE